MRDEVVIIESFIEMPPEGLHHCLIKKAAYMKKQICQSVILLFAAVAVHAQLAVTVSSPKVVGQKAVVSLAMKNGLTEKVESARAVCFLLDEQGKMVGQSTKWVIGGTKGQPPLEPKNEMTFNFVITSGQAFTSTNLTTKVSFSRVILAGGKVADANKTVNVTTLTR